MSLKTLLVLGLLALTIALYFSLEVAYDKGAQTACTQAGGDWNDDYCEVRR